MHTKHFMNSSPTFINNFYSDLKRYYDEWTGYKNFKKKFKSRLNYDLNLDNPITYNEKLAWKKLNDKNPLIPLTADKYAVRFYLKAILGETFANEILIPLLYTCNSAKNINFNILPNRFVVKPNHASRMHIFVNNNKNEIKEEIITESTKWLKTDYGLYNYEWGYKSIKRKLVFEKILEDKDGNFPRDFKFFCFHGKCKLIKVQENRFKQDNISTFVSPDFKKIKLKFGAYDSESLSIDPPKNLSAMLEIAEKLSSLFDAVRVDLYNNEGEIYFGEITHYPSSGWASFDPQEFDTYLGSFWKLEKKYWMRDMDKINRIMKYYKNNSI